MKKLVSVLFALLLVGSFAFPLCPHPGKGGGKVLFWQVGACQTHVHNLNPKAQRKARAEQQQQLAPLRKRVQDLEQLAIRLEREVRDWEQQMADPAFFSSGVDRRKEMIQYDRCKERLDQVMIDWERSQMELESAEN